MVSPDLAPAIALPFDRPMPLWSRAEKWACMHGLLPSRCVTLPDFMGIGVQKAGTTWLYHNLRRHPRLHLPNPKEHHFFDVHYGRSIFSYARAFRRRSGRLQGEVTPTYSALPADRVRVIRRLMPDLRVILLLRNPVDRAWSHLLHTLRRRNLSLEDLSEEDILAHFRGRSRRWGDYPFALRTWYSAYPQEQIFVGFFEDVGARPQELLGEIFRFLDLPETGNWERLPWNQVANAGPGVPMPAALRDLLREIYGGDLKQLQAVFGERVRPWVDGTTDARTASGFPIRARPRVEALILDQIRP
jgi:hypothetical protein